MHKIALILACWACLSHGGHVQISNVPAVENIQDTLSPMKALVTLLWTQDKPVGFSHASQGVRTSVGNRFGAAHSTRAAPSTMRDSTLSRRDAVLSTVGVAAAASLGVVAPALAEGEASNVTAPVEPAMKTVAVAGATGQTGRRVLEKLVKEGGLNVIGGVRDVAKAKTKLDEASVTVRGAMVQNVPSVDTSAVTLKQLDVVEQDVGAMTETLQGVNGLIIAVGFVPDSPFKMKEAAKAVDNEGTIKLIKAAKAAGVSKVVLITSILTDAAAWEQRGSFGFKVTNAFGGVLDEKLVAEQYLQASGLDYTIVRPGGLKAKPPEGFLYLSGYNTLNQGEISRDYVADVCIAALTDPLAKKRIVEIVETERGYTIPKKTWFYDLTDNVPLKGKKKKTQDPNAPLPVMDGTYSF